MNIKMTYQHSTENIENCNSNTIIVNRGFSMNAHEKHLVDQVKYWQRIDAEEREKNLKLEDIIKKIEKKIYGLEGDKK